LLRKQQKTLGGYFFLPHSVQRILVSASVLPLMASLWRPCSMQQQLSVWVNIL